MIIVAGHIILKAGEREAFLSKSRSSIEAARDNPHCTDFSVSADLLDLNRVNVFEIWDNRENLNAFRGDGPSEEMSTLIEKATVNEWEV